MEPNDPRAYLQQYITERLPQLVPGVFDGAFDPPSFAVDRQYQGPFPLPYPV